MSGFFTDDAVQSKPLRRKEGCMYCNLFEDCYTPKMAASGDNAKRILLLSGVPTETEDDKGGLFCGSSGSLLRKALGKKIDIERDCRKMAAVSCCPPKGVSVTTVHIEACRSRVLEEIKENPPSLIIALGWEAMQSLYHHRMQDLSGGVNKYRGFVMPDRQLDCWVACVMDPAYVLKMGGLKDVSGVIFKNDLQNALQYVGVPLPSYTWGDESECCEVVSEKKAVKLMKDLLNGPKTEIAFDYETNTLKPEYPLAELVSCSICDRWDRSYAFMITPKTQEVLSAVLRSTHIKKIASNAKFEERWTLQFMGHGVEEWSWDTMQAMHILDNRSGICSIKFICHILLGLFDYENYIHPYLVPKGDSRYNTIRQADEHKMLDYNAMDSLLEYRAAHIQRKYYDNPKGLDWRCFEPC